MIKNSIFILAILTCSISLLKGQSLNWLTWEDLNKQMAIQQKKIIVNFQKDACRWCDQLEQETLENEAIADYINDNFYVVRINVFSEQDIDINGKTYRSGEQGVHELARTLARNQITFPMIVFVDETFRVIQPIPGLQTVNKMQDILIYFGEDFYKNMPWKRFRQQQSNSQVNPTKSYFTGN